MLPTMGPFFGKVIIFQAGLFGAYFVLIDAYWMLIGNGIRRHPVDP